MLVTILCDNPNSWIHPYINILKEELILEKFEVAIIEDFKDIVRGDILVILSCEKIIPKEYLEFNENNLVVHESNLPKGKGWSPLTWQILEGKSEIPMTIFEADIQVDSGLVYLKDSIALEGTELIEEIREKQGLKTIELVLRCIKKYPDLKGEIQRGKSSYYRKRNMADSELDIKKSIEEQFNLLRVVDNDRYPAFFKREGEKYLIKIYKERD